MTYYVATLSRYVLADGDDEADARERGRAALHDLSPDVPINIRTARTATDDEIEFGLWHQQMVAAERV